MKIYYYVIYIVNYLKMRKECCSPNVNWVYVADSIENEFS